MPVHLPKPAFPRAVDIALSDRFVGDWRRFSLAGTSGTVVEFGFGSGLNLPHYPPAVRQVLAVEPDDAAWAAAVRSRRVERFATARGATAEQAVHRAGRDAAAVDLPDGCVDAVVATWTLCSIPDVTAALAQARRLVRPGGALHLVEHSLAPSRRVVAVQHAVQPLWGRAARGCHLDRDIPALLATAGFDPAGLVRRYATPVAALRPWTWFVAGAAAPR